MRSTCARIALLNAKARDEIEQLVQRIEKIEAAVEPRFQEHFIKAIAIPHENLEFPNLARTVKLPAGSREGAKQQDESAGLSRRQLRKLRKAGEELALRIYGHAPGNARDFLGLDDCADHNKDR